VHNNAVPSGAHLGQGEQRCKSDEVHGARCGFQFAGGSHEGTPAEAENLLKDFGGKAPNGRKKTAPVIVLRLQSCTVNDQSVEALSEVPNFVVKSGEALSKAPNFVVISGEVSR
jgi:hypothetical protein